MSEITSQKPRRRRFGVSVRTAMLLILVIACLLGWRVHRAETQTRAVAQLDNAKARILYDYEYTNGQSIRNGNPWAPPWLRNAIGDAYFREVAFVGFRDHSLGSFSSVEPTTDADLAPLEAFDRLETVRILGSDHVTDAGLAHLERLTGLREIQIHHALITDAGLAHLRRLTRLRKLDFNQNRHFFVRPWLLRSRGEHAMLAELSAMHLTNHEFNRQAKLRLSKHITDAGLAQLAGLTRMEELVLRAPGVTDAGLVHVSGMTGLHKLDLSYTGVTDAGLIHLRRMASLQSLDLSDTGVTGAGLSHLNGLTALRELNLASNELTADGLVPVGGMIGLRNLCLISAGVTDAGLAHLEGLDHLERLWLGQNSLVTDAALASLRGLKGLRELDLWGVKITDAGLVHLSGLTKLESLKLYWSDVTDAGLVHLSKLTALRHLDLGHSRITGPGLSHLRGLTRLRSLDLVMTSVSDEAVDAFEKAMPGVVVECRTPIEIVAEKMRRQSQSASAAR
jgi:hypothetical protein